MDEKKKNRLQIYRNYCKLYIHSASYSTQKHLLRINDWQNAFAVSQLTDGPDIGATVARAMTN